MSLTATLLTENTTVEDWYKLRDRIDMYPHYQRRGKLWSDSKQQLLIDSILNGYDIPKIYLADFALSNKLENPNRKLYAVIDGKQRLEAIFRFLDGQLRLSEEVEAPGELQGSLNGMDYQEMASRKSSLVESILVYRLAVVSVVADHVEDIQRMFVRLNFGVSVNAAERRNAKAGAVPAAIRSIADEGFFLERIKFSVQRGDDQNVAAKLLMFETQGSISDTKAKTLDRFADAYVRPDTWEEVLRQVDNVQEVLGRLSKVFRQKDPLLSSSGQIPVYYWLVRNHWQDDPTLIRSFIESFAEGVRRQLRAQRLAQEQGVLLSPSQEDLEYAEYYRLTRTSNDRESIDGRYKMLATKLAEWRSAYKTLATVRPRTARHN